MPDFFLKETIQSAGKYIVEGAFYPLQAAPSPVLRGIETEGLPYLLGYNGTSAKKTARLELITPQGDPLLASWQYGLGRSAAWTSDLKAQWAAGWLDWQGFGRFAAQLVSWTVPAERADGLEFQTRLDENRLVVELSAVQPDGSPWNFLTSTASIIDPRQEKQELKLKQIGPGQYRAESEARFPGVYLIRVGVNDADRSLGQTTLGLVVPYSPEYKTSGVDIHHLENLARVTGGSQLTNPAEVFEHNLPPIPSSHEIWLPLFILAALLFPIEVALRRLSLRKQDLVRVWTEARSRLPQRKSADAASQPLLLKDLFQARQRARQRRIPPETALTSPRTRAAEPRLPPDPEESPRPLSDSEEKPALEDQQVDALSRLKEAKKRARR